MQEAEHLLELEQAADLRTAIKEEEAKVNQADGSSDTVDEAEKLHLAQALAIH